jgi:hypothetical protein
MLPPLVMSECFSSTSRAPMWKARFSVVLAEVEVADGLIHGRLHERAADPFRALVPRPATTSCAGGRHLDDRAERWPQTPRGGRAGREVGEWIAETKQAERIVKHSAGQTLDSWSYPRHQPGRCSTRGECGGEQGSAGVGFLAPLGGIGGVRRFAQTGPWYAGSPLPSGKRNLNPLSRSFS